MNFPTHPLHFTPDPAYITTKFIVTFTLASSTLRQKHTLSSTTKAAYLSRPAAKEQEIYSLLGITSINKNNTNIRPQKRKRKMSSTASSAKLRSLYRAILRELPPRPILARPRSPLHTRLRSSFASSGPSSSSGATSEISSLSKIPTPEVAEQLVAYLRAQRTYATLLERYNPGMDMDDTERVRLTARRVGMDLPVTKSRE